MKKVLSIICVLVMHVLWGAAHEMRMELVSGEHEFGFPGDIHLEDSVPIDVLSERSDQKIQEETFGFGDHESDFGFGDENLPLLSESGGVEGQENVIAQRTLSVDSGYNSVAEGVDVQDKVGVVVSPTSETIQDVPGVSATPSKEFIIQHAESVLKSLQSDLAALKNKKLTVYSEYVDPLQRIEYLIDSINNNVFAWEFELVDTGDTLSETEKQVFQNLFDSLIKQRDRAEDLLAVIQQLLKQRSISDLKDMFQEMRAIENVVDQAKAVGLWGKNGSLRKAADRIQSFRFILDAAQEGAPVGEEVSYQQTVHGLREILDLTEKKLQVKQLAEIRKNNLLERAKTSLTALQELTTMGDYFTTEGKRRISVAKSVFSDLDAIITSDLDYKEHILVMHDNLAIDRLKEELLKRGNIASLEQFSLTMLEDPVVKKIAYELFSADRQPQEWYDSIDYISTHWFKNKLQERIDTMALNTKIFKQEYGSGAPGRLKKQSSFSINNIAGE